MPDRHSEETRELALTTLALTGDNVSRACTMLRATGHKISRHALQDWREQNPDRYAEIRATRAQEIERSVVQQARALMLDYGTLQAEANTETRRMLTAGEIKDPSTVSRNAAVAFGIATDKLLLLEGRPTSIAEIRSGDDILRSLADKGYIVDTTAVEEDGPPALPPAS